MDFRKALEQLGKQLQVPTRVWVVGGAALVLGYGLKRDTHDIDCILRKGKRSLLVNLATRVAKEQKLPEDWINFEFEKFNDIDVIDPQDFSKTESFGELVLAYASLELLLALKCTDARGSGFREEDFKDIAFCIKNLGLKTMDDVYEVVESKNLLDTTTDEEAFQLEKFLRTVLPKVATNTFRL